MVFGFLQFHFDQSKVRSEIRLREGRTKPIDVLLKNLNFSEDFDIEINEPYMVFKVNKFLQSFLLLILLLVCFCCSYLGLWGLGKNMLQVLILLGLLHFYAVFWTFHFTSIYEFEGTIMIDFAPCRSYANFW